jgi:RNAse (barnase) inhibitor barstar
VNPPVTPQLLRDAAAAGVVGVAPEDAEQVLEAAAAAGLCSVRIDLAGCDGKADLLARIADALEFPWWFGQNWDALADCLGDLEWLPAEGYVLLLDGADDLRRAAAHDYATVAEVFADASRGWREHGTPFWVFISGAEETT